MEITASRSRATMREVSGSSPGAGGQMEIEMMTHEEFQSARDLSEFQGM
jgi:hypothetical protein